MPDCKNRFKNFFYDFVFALTVAVFLFAIGMSVYGIIKFFMIYGPMLVNKVAELK